jgi:riboflavin kinase
MKTILPLYVKGKVVKGFGRGSKSLGIPTANYEQSIVDQLPDQLIKGIYYGWAKVGNEDIVHKCCLSLGWNPYFGNQVKSMVSQFQCIQSPSKVIFNKYFRKPT